MQDPFFADRKILMKIIFPPSSPVATKIFSLDASLSVDQAVLHIVETSRCGLDVNSTPLGLFVSEKNLWLEESTTLSTYKKLIQSVEAVYLKEKKEAEDSTADWVRPSLLVVGAAGAALTLLMGVYTYTTYRKCPNTSPNTNYLST